jgi:hypothetical protein
MRYMSQKTLAPGRPTRWETQSPLTSVTRELGTIGNRLQKIALSNAAAASGSISSDVCV